MILTCLKPKLFIDTWGWLTLHDQGEDKHQNVAPPLLNKLKNSLTLTLWSKNCCMNLHEGIPPEILKERREPLSHVTLSKRPKGTSTTLIIALRGEGCHTQFWINN